MPSYEELNIQTTSAIVEMQESARKVAELEERLAGLTRPWEPEGKIARRSAVRAWVTAGDDERAQRFVRNCIVEDNSDNALCLDQKPSSVRKTERVDEQPVNETKRASAQMVVIQKMLAVYQNDGGENSEFFKLSECAKRFHRATNEGEFQQALAWLESSKDG